MPTKVGSKRKAVAADVNCREKKRKTASAVQSKSTSLATRKQPPRACKKRKTATEAEDTIATAPRKKLKQSPVGRKAKEHITPDCEDAPAKSERQNPDVVDSGSASLEHELWISPVDQWNVEEASPVTEPSHQQRWQGYMKDADGNEHAVLRVCVEFKRIYWKSRKQDASAYADFEEPVSPKSLPK